MADGGKTAPVAEMMGQERERDLARLERLRPIDDDFMRML